jgi:hypothetical protein
LAPTWTLGFLKIDPAAFASFVATRRRPDAQQSETGTREAQKKNSSE